MADEIKTILKIDGDASGAKRAADEAIAATQKLNAEARRAVVEQMGETLRVTAPAGTSGPPAEQSAALEQLAERERSAADGAANLQEETLGLDRASGKSARTLNTLAETISAIDPRLGMLVRTSARLSQLWSVLFSPLVLGVGAATGVILTLVGAFRQAYEETRRARIEYEKYTAALAKSRTEAAGKEEDIATKLAKAGIVSPEATAKALGLQRRLVASGVSEETAARIMPLAVDSAGRQTTSDEELLDLAAAAEYGELPTEIEKPRDLYRVRGRAGKYLQRNAAQIAEWRGALSQRVARRDRLIAEGNPDAIRQALERMGEVIPEEQIESAVRDIQLMREGQTGAVPFSGILTSAEDRARFQSRQQQAAQRAMRLGLISPELARRREEVSPGGEYLRSWEDVPVVGSLVSAGPRSARRADETEASRERGRREAPATQPAAPVVNNYYGITVTGGPGNLFAGKTRVHR